MDKKILETGGRNRAGKGTRRGPSRAEMRIRLRLEPYCLTKKETEVTLLLLEGRKRDEILVKCSIGINTLKSHIRQIYRKTGATGRTDLSEKLFDLQFRA